MPSSQIVFRRGHHIVVRSYSAKRLYYTIVNTRCDTHSHVYKNELVAAIMICKSAHRGITPEHYPAWMRESIRRILDDH